MRCFEKLPTPHKLPLLPLHPICRVLEHQLPTPAHADGGLWRPARLAPVPQAAMEQSGHAQVPTLLVALVRRQAGRAGWKAEITYENKEE